MATKKVFFAHMSPIISWVLFIFPTSSVDKRIHWIPDNQIKEKIKRKKKEGVGDRLALHWMLPFHTLLPCLWTEFLSNHNRFKNME